MLTKEEFIKLLKTKITPGITNVQHTSFNIIKKEDCIEYKGKIVNPQLTFDQLWEIYKSLKEDGISTTTSPELRELFPEIFGNEELTEQYCTHEMFCSPTFWMEIMRQCGICSEITHQRHEGRGRPAYQISILL